MLFGNQYSCRLDNLPLNFQVSLETDFLLAIIKFQVKDILKEQTIWSRGFYG